MGTWIGIGTYRLIFPAHSSGLFVSVDTYAGWHSCPDSDHKTIKKSVLNNNNKNSFPAVTSNIDDSTVEMAFSYTVVKL